MRPALRDWKAIYATMKQVHPEVYESVVEMATALGHNAKLTHKQTADVEFELMKFAADLLERHT